MSASCRWPKLIKPATLNMRNGLDTIRGENEIRYTDLVKISKIKIQSCIGNELLIHTNLKTKSTVMYNFNVKPVIH